MSEHSSETFDCVQNMRQIRDRLNVEIAGLSYGELVKWLRTHRYASLLLGRLANRAAHQADAADQPSVDR